MAEISKQYQKKTDREHILDNPDTYIGSIENVEQKVYVYENETSFSEINMEQYNPGLFKLFDEGIVNCRDHYIRMQSKEDGPENEKVTQINISINNGEITMYNNGNGIDVEIHPEYKLWIPEMIFGHLRTSTNYDKKQKKITGGKNGDQWAHIELAEPIPMPMFEEAILSLTEMRKADMVEYLEGKKDYKGKTGGKAIHAILSDLDLKSGKENR